MKIEKQRKNIKAKSKPQKLHIKTFDEYFQGCIKNKTIPPDAPPYLKKLLKSNQLLLNLLKNALLMVDCSQSSIFP